MAVAVTASGCKVTPKAEIVIVNGSEPETIDPQLANGQPDGRISNALFEGLTRLDAVTGAAIPGLARSWEVSGDGLTYTFHLREGLRWSTGEPIGAEDVVYSWRRLANPSTGARYASLLFYVRGGGPDETPEAPFRPGRLAVAAPDPGTVVVGLNHPTPYFPELCAFRALALIPRHLIERLGDHGHDWIRSRPLPCSGAYQLESWALNHRIRVRRNPHYWDASSVRTETFDFLPTDSASTALNLYLTGAADWIADNRSIPTDLNDALAARRDFHRFQALATYLVRINTTRPPLGDARVRRALALAIDKRRIVEQITRLGEAPARSLTPPSLGDYEPPEGLGYNPPLARELLAAAGHPDGRGVPTLEYLYSASGGGGGRIHERIGTELQEMLAANLGVRLQLRPMEWKSFQIEQQQMRFDLCRGSWVADYADPTTFLDVFLSKNRNNQTGWRNPGYDQLLEDASKTTDPRQRLQLLRKAESILVDLELPVIPIYHYNGMIAFDPAKIAGIHTNRMDEHPLRAIRRIPPTPAPDAR